MYNIKTLLATALMAMCLTLAILSSDVINRDVYASISIVTGALLFKELPINKESENK